MNGKPQGVNKTCYFMKYQNILMAEAAVSSLEHLVFDGPVPTGQCDITSLRFLMADDEDHPQKNEMFYFILILVSCQSDIFITHFLGCFTVHMVAVLFILCIVKLSVFISQLLYYIIL